MKNTIQKFKYIIFGVLLVIGATAVQAVQISVPSANGSGFFLQSSTTGQYLPVSLTAGSNITIATTSSNVTISSTGGGGSGFGEAWTLGTNIFSQSMLAPTTTQNIHVSGTGTSTFIGGLEAWRQVAFPYFHATSTTATSTIANGLRLGNTAATRDNLLQIDCSRRSYPASITVGGCVSIDGGTTNQGTNLFVHNNTNAVGTGRMVNFIQDNTTVTQDMWLASSSCANCTALNLKGFPTGKGILKIEATGSGTGFSNSSAVSLDLANETDAQGIFIKGAVSGTGKLTNWVDSNSSTLGFFDSNGLFSSKYSSSTIYSSFINASSTLFSAATGYFNNILATSTTATSTFMGNVSITDGTNYGFVTGAQPFNLSATVNLPYQMSISNKSTGTTAMSGYNLANANTTNNANPFAATYYGGTFMAGSGFALYPGLLPNDVVTVASDANVRLAALSSNVASSSISFSVGPGFTSANYDMIITASSTTGRAQTGIGTTTPRFPLQIAATTTPQLSLSGADTDNAWNMRSIGNQFFLATSSPTTYATSSRSAFSIDTNGFPAFSALAGVGCAQFDATGKFSNTGSACGSGGGGGGVGWASSTADTNSIYSYGTGGVFVRGNSSAATSSRALLEVNAPGGIMPFYVGSSTSLFEVDGASNGFVSVGSTTPWGKFSVNPNALGSGVPELVVGSSSATRFLINGAGNIGIGTTTPTNPLTIFSSTGGQISLSAGTGVSQAVMRYDGSNFTISSTTVAGTATSTPAAFTLNTTGVGFFSGTTTNSAATGFAINGTGYLSGLSSSASTQTGSLCLSSTNEVINDSGVCIVSDLRAKNVKGLFTDALSEIAKIKPISYFYKPEFNGELQKNTNYSAEQLGLGAQDLQKVDPRLVEVYTKDGKNNVFSYKQGEASAPKIPALVALALGGVKELNQKVENINLGTVTRSAQDNWQWAVMVLLALWIVRLEVKLKKRD